MKTLEEVLGENQSNKNPGSQLTRRNFLKSFGAAVGGGALLGIKPAMAREKLRNRLNPLAFLSNPDELYWRAVRQQYYLNNEVIHMNTGTLGAMPKMVVDNVNANNLVLADQPYPTAYEYPFSLYGDPDDRETYPGVHKVAANFLGATEDCVGVGCPNPGIHEIIITNCTTSGMSFVANGLELQEGDEVITTMHEHPGGWHCWEILRDRRNVTLTELPFSGIPGSTQDIVDLFENAITANTKVISFCHINYTTGLRMPVKEICAMARSHGIISVIDGAHAIGMLDLDFHDIDADFYACSPQKWLCAPPGVGVLYIRDGIGTEGDLIEKLWPTVTEGYHTTRLQMQLEQRGQRSVPNLVGLMDAMDFQSVIGKAVVEQRVMDLSTYLKARLVEIPTVELICSSDPEQISGLTALNAKGNTSIGAYINLNRRLKDYGIFTRFTSFQDTSGGPSRAALRVSTHIYNNYDQIDYLCQAIEENLDIIP